MTEGRARDLVRSAEGGVRDLVRSVAFPVLRPRRFHGFGLGLYKTGTHSLAAVFARYRAAHEPRERAWVRIAQDRFEGTLSAAEARASVRRLDKRQWLEMNSSWANSLVVDELVEAFPDAKFVLTIRDCYSWMDSVFNQLLARGRRAVDRSFDHWYMESMSRGPHQAGDQVLAEHGIWPLDVLLRIWGERHAYIIEKVPSERLLIVRTHEIGQAVPRLAEFFGVPEATLIAERSHQFKAAGKFWLLSEIDRTYLADRVQANCGELMRAYFPEIGGLEDVRGYRPADIEARA